MNVTKYLAVLLIALSFACKNVKKEAQKMQDPEPMTITEKIAQAHGYDNWAKVNTLTFTFNVDRDSTHFERSWIWKPRSNEVTSITTKDTLVYLRKNMDSTAYKTNAGFINDRYWLLAPFNLIWDAESYTHKHQEETTAPISGKTMQKLTIVYNNEDGYTPGDAYDFYFEDDYLIKEWVFRKTNQDEPSMITTWENYWEENDFKWALDHKKAGEDFNLYFTGVHVE